MIRTTPADIYAEFQRELDYKTRMGFVDKAIRNTKFVEGDQWPKATKRTMHLPRPIINMCDWVVENKQSNILAQSLKMVFTPEEFPMDDTDKLDRLNSAAKDFSDASCVTWADIGQDELNEDVVNDAIIVGSGIWHYYWDNSITGGMFTQYVGKMQGETIDFMDIAYANPQLKASQIQKQDYIIIRGRKETEMLKQRAKQNGDNWEAIQPDQQDADEKYDNAKIDLEKGYKTTTYTKYYKQNGEVYWTEVTRNAAIQKPRTLKPNGAKSFKVYPVEMLIFKRKKKCVFGRSMIDETVITNRQLNTGLGMMLLSVQQTAWPKILAKAGALTQSITNEPGEIITDNNSAQAYDGVKFMQPPNFSNMPLTLSDKLLELTRMTTGVTEVSTGEQLGANMAASAIIALQSQAKKPNEYFQNRLFRSIKNVGKIYEEFYKCYYNLPRPIKSKDEQGKEYTRTFTGTDHADVNFALDISITPKTTLDDSLAITTLDKFKEWEWIDKYSYVKYAPQNTIPQELVRDFEKEKEQLEEQQAIQAQATTITDQLTPEEQQYLSQNPQILDQVMGGEQNAM